MSKSKSIECEVVTGIRDEQEISKKVRLRETPTLAKLAESRGEGTLRLYNLKALGELCHRDPHIVRNWINRNAGLFLGGTGVETRIVGGGNERLFFSLEQKEAAVKFYETGQRVRSDYFKAVEVADSLDVYLPQSKRADGRISRVFHNWFDRFPETSPGVKNIFGVDVVKFSQKAEDEYFLPRQIHLFSLTHDDHQNLRQVQLGLPKLYRDFGIVVAVARDDEQTDRPKWLIETVAKDGEERRYMLECPLNACTLYRVKGDETERLSVPLTSTPSEKTFQIDVYDRFKIDEVALGVWGERVYWQFKRLGLDPKYHDYVFLPEVARTLGVNIDKVRHQVHESNYGLGIEGDEKVPGCNPSCIHPKLAKHIIQRTSTRLRLKRTHITAKKLAAALRVSPATMKTWIKDSRNEMPGLVEEFEGGVFVRNLLSESDYQDISRVPRTQGKLGEFRRQLDMKLS